MNFYDLGLSEKTVQAIEEFGIKEPTTVQCDVIPSILQGKDVFTIAPGGCGKTCSYVFPLIDIISRKKPNDNILIITPNSEQAIVASDRLAVFNKYHEINEATIQSSEDTIDNEANVIIGSPDLLVELLEEQRIDLSNVTILVVDDINLIKKNKQLGNLEKVLDILPADKQNIVYTNRRSRETQSILEKILKAPEEIKVDKDKEQEAAHNAQTDNTTEEKNAEAPKQARGKRRQQSSSPRFVAPQRDKQAVELNRKYNSFLGKTPEFVLIQGNLAEGE